MTVRARVPFALALAIAVAACGPGDSSASDDAVVHVPESFAGFDSMPLVSASKGGAAPAGTLYYREVSGSLDWYVLARPFSAGHAYRVVMTSADGHEYAVASSRARGDGSFLAHGVETTLMNRQCVGTEDPSQRPLADAVPITVAVKQDGSPPASSSGTDPLGSRSALPCNGNGDGVFEYVLRANQKVAVNP